MKAVCLNSNRPIAFTVGKIYNFYATNLYPERIQIITNQGSKVNVVDWTDDFTKAGNNTFRIIRFDYYLKEAELCLK